jgi:uncharacterized surface protein with fasciclin (FAS1) repeats
VTSSLLRRRPRVVALLGVLAVVLTACGAEEPAGTSASDTGTTSAAPSETSAPPPSGEPFGPGCSALPAEGEGSIAGMADDPVGRAANNNPALSMLVQALVAADLGDSLNGQEAVTVLAPANAAFEAVPPADLQALLADTPRLTAVLTHHVISGRLAPEELAGTHTTLNNDQVTIDAGREMFTISGEGTLTGTVATVVCANLQTANATVYIIDQVLAPAA